MYGQTAGFDVFSFLSMAKYGRLTVMNDFYNQLQGLNVNDFNTTQVTPWDTGTTSMDDTRLIGGCFGFGVGLGCFGCFGCLGCIGRCGGCGGCGGRCGGCGGRCGRCGR